MIEFNVIREGDRVIGFSLFGSETEEDQSFCGLFPRAKVKGKAHIQFNEVAISFIYEDRDEKAPDSLTPWGERRTLLISIDNGRALKQLLSLEGPYKGMKLQCTFWNSWGGGFQLRVVPK